MLTILLGEVEVKRLTLNKNTKCLILKTRNSYGFIIVKEQSL